MHIVHISDFHVFADRPETPLVRLDAEKAARRVVADIVSFAPKIDAVCLTGDLADGGSAADYTLLVDILSPLSAPVFVVPGNHDRRDTMREAFAHLPFADATTLHYETKVGSTRILALDTLIEGKVAGELGPDQLLWLEQRLAHPHEGVTLILMHHPAFRPGIPEIDEATLQGGREDFARIVRGYNGTLRLLSGHVHRPCQAIWQGKLGFVAGSPAFQHALELRPGVPEPGIISEPYAYFIHRMTGDDLAVHIQYVDID